MRSEFAANRQELQQPAVRECRPKIFSTEVVDGIGIRFFDTSSSGALIIFVQTPAAKLLLI